MRGNNYVNVCEKRELLVLPDFDCKSLRRELFLVNVYNIKIIYSLFTYVRQLGCCLVMQHAFGNLFNSCHCDTASLLNCQRVLRRFQLNQWAQSDRTDLDMG